MAFDPVAFFRSLNDDESLTLEDLTPDDIETARKQYDDAVKKDRYGYGRSKLQYQAWAAAGKCVGCGREPRPGLRQCTACAEYAAYCARRAAAKRAEQGRCRQCPEPCLPNHASCLWHCVLTRARTLAKGRQAQDLARALIRKFNEQQGRCVYTGRALVFGVNAEHDHVVPRSRGGSNLIENLFWSDGEINRAKGDRTPAEFLALCREVVAWMEKKEDR
jgi:5-methylcytosine-specific restriction endonuclease McrA